MRQLHLVGFTSDHSGLILAGRRGAKTGSYVIALEDALLDQLEVARRMQRGEFEEGNEGGPRGRSHSALSPREMQARLRAGRTVADVASEAGVDLEWVERFAAPVLAEQAAAVARAGELTLKTPRRGMSDRPLAASVLRNLVDRGVRMTEDELASAWSANHVVDSEWSVWFTFTNRGKQHRAEWTLDMAAGTLVSNGRLGTELGFVDPARHAPFVRVLPAPRTPRPPAVPPPEPEVVEVAAEVPPATPRRRRPRRKAAGARKKVAPPRQKASAKKAPSRKKAAGTRKATAVRKSPTAAKRAPAKKAAAKKAAAKKAPARKAPARKKVAAKKTVAARRAPAVRKTTGVKKRAAPANKAPAKRAPARRPAATKRSPAKRAPARRPAATKRSPAKRAAASRTARPERRPTSTDPLVASLLSRPLTDRTLPSLGNGGTPARTERPLRARPPSEAGWRGESVPRSRPLRARPLRARPLANLGRQPSGPTIRATRAADQFRSTAETPRIGADFQT